MAQRFYASPSAKGKTIMARVIKANDAQRAEYAKTGAVYPLYGYVAVQGVQCPVEDLRGHWQKPDPVYELIAPKGKHFGHEGDACQSCLHTMLGHSLRDIASDADCATLSECDGEL